MPWWPIERTELAIDGASVREVDVPIDELGDDAHTIHVHTTDLSSGPERMERRFPIQPHALIDGQPHTWVAGPVKQFLQHASTFMRFRRWTRSCLDRVDSVP